MSKIYLIGDSHIGLGYPNTSDKWFNVHEEYFNSFLLPLLQKEVSEGDIIVHLGDLFDNRNVIPINLLNYAMDIVEKIASIAPLHILVGNHDCWHKSSSEINTIRPFKHINNVFIYDKTTKIEYDGINILMMPYIEKKSEQIKLIKENVDCHYLFCHSDLNGAKMHLSSAAHRNLDKIDVDEFSNFRKVYSGHIHIGQVNKNFTFVGNNFQMDRNDIDNPKGIIALDIDKNEEVFFENTISPKFVKVYIKNEDDIEILNNISMRNYIDVYISSSLLTNNRKLRRKIESLLEVGKFASIEYIDDINVVKEEKIVESKNLNSDINISLDFKETIKDYINSQEYSVESIKNGILSEFQEIIRIFDDEFKK